VDTNQRRIEAMTKKQLLKHVAKAYPGVFPVDREQALEHDQGDTLADFIYLELDETLTDAGNIDLDEAERVMFRAREDVNAVLDCVQKLNSRR
jgi:hypothetical protein